MRVCQKLDFRCLRGARRIKTKENRKISIPWPSILKRDFLEIKMDSYWLKKQLTSSQTLLRLIVVVLVTLVSSAQVLHPLRSVLNLWLESAIAQYSARTQSQSFKGSLSS